MDLGDRAGTAKRLLRNALMKIPDVNQAREGNLRRFKVEIKEPIGRDPSGQQDSKQIEGYREEYDNPTAACAVLKAIDKFMLKANHQHEVVWHMDLYSLLEVGFNVEVTNDDQPLVSPVSNANNVDEELKTIVALKIVVMSKTVATLITAVVLKAAVVLEIRCCVQGSSSLQWS